jgi:hypothetical protein
LLIPLQTVIPAKAGILFIAFSLDEKVTKNQDGFKFPTPIVAFTRVAYISSPTVAPAKSVGPARLT